MTDSSIDPEIREAVMLAIAACTGKYNFVDPGKAADAVLRVLRERGWKSPEECSSAIRYAMDETRRIWGTEDKP